jgi:aminopeptidase N
MVLAAAPYSAASATSERPRPGAPGLGDRLYPLLGNGGYDARHYDLDLRYATSAPSQGVDGTMTMSAVATQALSRFDLDFRGTGLASVSVDGRPARFARHGGELVITPARPIHDGATFVVQVRHFTSEPTVADPANESADVFFQTAEGSAVAGQPNLMNVVYPSNDYPSDKATFSFRFDVPAGETAVANGVLTGRHTRAGRSIWTYAERQPMATELTQLVVGKYSVIDRGTIDGVQIRDVVPTDQRATYDRLLSVEPSQFRWMVARVGKYPFPLYGTLVVTANIGFALETQTLSLFDTTWWTGEPRAVWAPTMTHELSHMWFGDSVSPATWSDIWLNEGHASWYEFTWAAPRGYLAGDTGVHATTLNGLMRWVYARGDQWRASNGPVALPRNRSQQFSNNVYFGGALVLYALRQKVGPAAFDRLERGWAQQERGTSRSTDDFIAFASRSTGRDLTGFLRAWLYGTTTPPMPGHPDWTVEPVG